MAIMHSKSVEMKDLMKNMNRKSVAGIQ